VLSAFLLSNCNISQNIEPCRRLHRNNATERRHQEDRVLIAGASKLELAGRGIDPAKKAVNEGRSIALTAWERKNTPDRPILPLKFDGARRELCG
jgi:hypothetical protein